MYLRLLKTDRSLINLFVYFLEPEAVRPLSVFDHSALQLK